jgi:mannose-6-phosphate isomerase
MQNSNKIFRLEGVVQHYAWGGYDFIPALLHRSNEEARPFAEYWMGAHDNAPAQVVTNREKERLSDLIVKEPTKVLGEEVYKKFGRLPYLLKILDVKDMLSIQVHPDKKSAEQAFGEENKKGLPLQAPQRNYKDANHKPELMLALSDFWLLHGFKSKEKLLQVMEETPELRFLTTVFNTEGYGALYQRVMEMPQAEVNDRLHPLLDRIRPLYTQNKLSKGDEDFWAARAALTYNRGNDIDRGIFSVYFFNLVHCKPDEAVFQAAGVPHAYLEGQNVEIMANSDNVLRGGLTPKHIDVAELIKHIKFEETTPKILSGQKRNNVERVYKTPAPDFELSKFELEEGLTANFVTSTADILFLKEGLVTISDGEKNLELKSGEAVIAFKGSDIEISSHSASSLYRATVPLSV